MNSRRNDTWVDDDPGVFVVCIDDDIVELYADRTRALPVIDPSVVLFFLNSTDSCAYWALSGTFSAEYFSSSIHRP